MSYPCILELLPCNHAETASLALILAMVETNSTNPLYTSKKEAKKIRMDNSLKKHFTVSFFDLRNIYIFTMYSYSFIDCEKAQKPCLPDGTTKTKGTSAVKRLVVQVSGKEKKRKYCCTCGYYYTLLKKGITNKK